MAGAGTTGGRYLQAHKAHWVLRKEQYIYIYIVLRKEQYIYIYILFFTQNPIYIYTYTHTHIYNVCIYIHIYIYMCVYIYIYTCVKIFGYTVSSQNLYKTPLILSPQEDTKEEIMKEFFFYLKDLLHRETVRYTGLQNYEIV